MDTAATSTVSLKPRKTPKRKKGQGRGPSRLSGAVMDVTAAADFLGVSPKFVRARISSGQLPSTEAWRPGNLPPRRAGAVPLWLAGHNRRSNP
jgi:hypothetical protein